MIFSYVNIPKEYVNIPFSGLKVCKFQVLYDYLILGINVKTEFYNENWQKSTHKFF